MLQSIMSLAACAALSCGCAASPASEPAAPCAPYAQATTQDHHEHGHPHETAPATPPTSAEARVIAHAELKSFENNGNQLVGVATASLGAQNFEVWRTSVAPGSMTPAHTHASEEIFVFLRGKGRARIGDQVVDFEAPATVIAPAHIQHQFENTGTEPTDAIVVVGIGSQITNAEGEEMQLPWRK